jgi:RNA polymerase sigma-70 factor (ECF subfamily)
MQAHTPEQQAQIRAMAADLHPRLLRFFRSKVPYPDCHDLAQQVFVAFLKQTREKTVNDPRAYLWGIARLSLLKFITRRRPVGEQFDSARQSMAAVGTSLSMHFDRRNRLTAALRELPLEQQLAFELRHGEELKLEEVAAAMEVSLATVKRYLKSAQDKLRELLQLSEDEAARQAALAYREN